MPSFLTPADIRALRDRLDLTQTALADRLNAAVPGLALTKISISRWENGWHKPSPVAVAALRRLMEQEQEG